MLALGILGAALAVVIIGWAIHLNWDIILHGDNDFASFYAGGKLAGTPGLYSAEATVRMQAEFARVKPSELFVRPAFYAALLKPLTLLPYRAAYAVFVALNVCALVAFLAIFARGDPLLWVVGGVSMPVLTALVVGQDILLLVFVCGAAARLAQSNWRFAAGVAVSLCAVKFHLFLFIPPLLLVRKEWRALGGLCLSLCGLFLLGAAAQGPAWPLEYARMLGNPQIDPTPYTPPNLRGLVAAMGGRLTAELILAALASAGVLYFAAKTRTFEAALAASLAGGLLISHHAYIQDCCLLIPVAALGGRGALRTGALILLTPPFYFLLGAGTVGILLPLGLLLTLVLAAIDVNSGGATSTGSRS